MGLCVSYHPERFNKCFGLNLDDLPNIPGAHPHGISFDSPKKYLSNESDINAFWSFVTRKSEKVQAINGASVTQFFSPNICGILKVKTDA